MSDIGSVHSYATEGLRLWRERVLPHGWKCPCLYCADARAAIIRGPHPR